MTLRVPRYLATLYQAEYQPGLEDKLADLGISKDQASLLRNAGINTVRDAILVHEERFRRIFTDPLQATMVIHIITNSFEFLDWFTPNLELLSDRHGGLRMIPLTVLIGHLHFTPEVGTPTSGDYLDAKLNGSVSVFMDRHWHGTSLQGHRLITAFLDCYLY